MTIAIDFDGTIAEHYYPEIGPAVPGAFDWMKRFRAAGAKLILWTMRSDGPKDGSTLTQAVTFCKALGVTFDGVNTNPSQLSWTSSPKAYANIYIDDAAFGCPLKEGPRLGARPFVDWSLVGPAIMARIEEGK